MKKTPEPWTQAAAIALCVQIESFCPRFGTHVALTGGALYKTGPRSDLDLIFYRHGGTAIINMAGLFDELYRIGIRHITGSGWRFVGYLHDTQKIDLLFPG